MRDRLIHHLPPAFNTFPHIHPYIPTQWTNTYEVTCHIALNAYGFGGVTRVINGIECAPQPDARQVSRVNYFKSFCNVLAVPIPPEDTLYCYSLQPPPTPVPGPTPTQLPTTSPTKMPALPTTSPSEQPTSPTPSPSRAPTAPSQGPTVSPTRPTTSPTPSPTRLPSSAGAWEGWATTTQFGSGETEWPAGVTNAENLLTINNPNSQPLATMGAAIPWRFYCKQYGSRANLLSAINKAWTLGTSQEKVSAELS